MTARAAKGYVQMILPFIYVSLHHRSQQRMYRVNELSRQPAFEYIIPHLFVIAGQLLEARNIERIWQKAHVKHYIRLCRYAVFESEGADID